MLREIVFPVTWKDLLGKEVGESPVIFDNWSSFNRRILLRRSYNWIRKVFENIADTELVFIKLSKGYLLLFLQIILLILLKSLNVAIIENFEENMWYSHKRADKTPPQHFVWTH